jgi:hypothetical protein
MTTTKQEHRSAVPAPWIEAFGEAELIGGWAEVALDRDFAALIERSGYQVFLTSYDPVQLFVQNRTERGFEIHAMPGLEGRRQVTTHCAYQIVGLRVGKAKPSAGSD